MKNISYRSSSLGLQIQKRPKVHLSIYKIIIRVMTIYITALYNILIHFIHGNSQLVGALSM
jgi:hypothetical protein